MERHDRAGKERRLRPRARERLLITILALTLTVGCGGDGGGSGNGGENVSGPTSTPAATQPAQPTSAATPTATAPPGEPSPTEPGATSSPTSLPTPTAVRVEGVCFVGAPPCTGTSLPTTRDACCDLSRKSAGPLPVSWCPAEELDPATLECRACSDPCAGRPTVTPTPTLASEPTATPGGCDAAHRCREGDLCELPPGVCAGDLDAGTCVGVPFTCSNEIEPVCGCDGFTYGNDCLRRSARAQKAHDGSCPAEECGDDCDCYATRTFATSCPLECATCDNYWTCEGSRCIEHCGPVPPDRCEALCFDNESCGSQAFCKKPVGHCDGLGACRPSGVPCPSIVDPVCGCDGQTYANECIAGNAGVSLAHRGPCGEEPTPTPSPTPETSPSPGLCDIANPCPRGELCELPTGVCASDLDSGTCVAVPDACFGPDEPVCGCDGLTYGNDCLRRAARVQKSADGPCATIECGRDCDCYATRAFATACPLACANCGSFWTCDDGHCIEHCGFAPLEICRTLCVDSRRCPPESFCQKPIAQCDGSGACRLRPPRSEPCPDVVDPVCGCNGQTYSNECEAFRVSVNIAHRGECRPRCGTIAGIPCPLGQFCEYPPASCHIADLEGECFDLPETCPLVVDPVCGCDGVTYTNDCERQRTLVQLDRPGACEQPGGP